VPGKLILSAHAAEAVALRAIDLTWIEMTIFDPDRSEPDPQPGRTRSFKAIAAFWRQGAAGYSPAGRRGCYGDHGLFRSRREAMIQTTYDPEVDALFVRFAAEGVASVRTEEVAPGVMLDFDADGNAISLEVLDVRSRSTATRTKGAAAAE
jgi:uncharacterized protein YuzE